MSYFFFLFLSLLFYLIFIRSVDFKSDISLIASSLKLVFGNINKLSYLESDDFYNHAITITKKSFTLLVKILILTIPFFGCEYLQYSILEFSFHVSILLVLCINSKIYDFFK